jgi:hypothetical protein
MNIFQNEKNIENKFTYFVMLAFYSFFRGKGDFMSEFLLVIAHATLKTSTFQIAGSKVMISLMEQQRVLKVSNAY